MYTIFVLSKCLYRQVYKSIFYWNILTHGKKAGPPIAHKQVKKQLSVCFKYTIDWREWYQNTLECWFQIQASLHSLLILHRKSLLFFSVILFLICCKLSSLVCCCYFFFASFIFLLFSVITFTVCLTRLMPNNRRTAEVYFTLWSVENTLLRGFLCVVL